MLCKSSGCRKILLFCLASTLQTFSLVSHGPVVVCPLTGQPQWLCALSLVRTEVVPPCSPLHGWSQWEAAPSLLTPGLALWLPKKNDPLLSSPQEDPGPPAPALPTGADFWK